MWGLGVDILLRVSVPSVTPPISFGPRQADFPKGMGWVWGEYCGVVHHLLAAENL